MTQPSEVTIECRVTLRVTDKDSLVAAARELVVNSWPGTRAQELVEQPAAAIQYLAQFRLKWHELLGNLPGVEFLEAQYEAPR